MFPPDIKIEPVFWDSSEAWKVGILKFPNDIEDLIGSSLMSIKWRMFYPV
jgi:hypothetical protein